MAARAKHRRMLANQRKTRQRMVEAHLPSPCHRAMARRAVGAEPPGVRVIFGMAGHTGHCYARRLRGRRVARPAFQRPMRTRQRKARHFIMVEIGDVPIAAGVAARAFGAILPLVRVVLGMAGDATCFGLWRRIIDAVAASAGRCCMLAQQRERGLAMVEACVGPRRWIVAIGAGRAARPIVRVIARMATNASPCRIADGIIGTMTTRAGRRRMLTQQREIGVARMVERRRRPGRCAVARRTIGAARAIMPIIARMARDAGRRCPCPALSDMASHAALCTVRAGQRKSGAGVIERQCRCPSGNAMAALAIAAQPPPMRFIAHMATGARGWRGAKMGAGAMASGAGRARMAADQRIIGQRMVECRAIETHQRKAPPMMVAMAGSAFLCPRGGATVKSLPRRNVAGDTAMTGKAAAVLRGPRERLMAAVARCFEPRVRTGQRAGCDQPFHDALRDRALRAQHQRHRKKQAKPESHQYSISTYAPQRCAIRRSGSG